MYDKPEIYFDVNATLKDGGAPGSATNKPGHYQVAPTAEEAKIDGTPTTGADGVISSYLATPTTWKVEYFVPFSLLKDMDGTVVPTDRPIGFDVSIADGESAAPGVRQRAVWANDGNGPGANESWGNMDDCGTITLSAEEAVGANIVQKLDVKPVIDGVIDAAWADVTKFDISVPFKDEAATVGDAGETYWKALWDADGMYFLINVADDNWNPFWGPGGGGASYMYDKLELYFDTNLPRKDGKGGQGSTAGSIQIAPDSKDGILDGTMQTATAFGEDYNWAIKVADPTYVCEYFIPWNIVNDATGTAFDKMTSMGFDVTVIDHDTGEADGTRKRVNWANAGAIEENWNNMDDAGVIMFDGALEVIMVDKVTVTGGGTITTDNGTLQMVATVEPIDATAQKVKWTVENGSGRATIDSKGVLTGMLNGTVTVKGTATDGSFNEGKATVTITGQKVTIAEINYVKNGYFEMGTDKAPWGGGDVVDGVLVCDPDGSKPNPWDWTTSQIVAVAQEDKDKPFTFSFRAWSDSPTTDDSNVFNVDFEDSNNGYSRYGVSTHMYATGGTSDWTFFVTAEPTMYTFDVTFSNMAENARQSLQFMLGKNDGPLYLDSIVLVKNEDLGLVSSARSLANAKSKVQLYPNPAQTQLTVSKIAVANSKVSVYNAVGQKLMEKTANGTQAKFDVANLRKGMYFVRFSDGTSEKFIKQ